MPSGGIKPRRKGATYERTVAQYLRDRGHPGMERRIMGMDNDTGDLTGWPGVVIECKNQKTFALSAWSDQLEREIVQAKADTGVVIIKRPRAVNVGEHYALMPVWLWFQLVREAGY